MTSLMLRYQIIDKHTSVDMFCSKWISHHISHLRVFLQLDLALRNPFSRNKSTIVYIYWLIHKGLPGGGYGLFLKKYSDFGGRKKI